MKKFLVSIGLLGMMVLSTGTVTGYAADDSASAVATPSSATSSLEILKAVNDEPVATEVPAQGDKPIEKAATATSRAEYVTMRARWRDRLIATKPDMSDPNVKAYLTDLAAQSQTLWATMDRSANRSRLWPKKSSDTTSADYTSMFTNIKMLTLGYYNPVSQQYQNPEVYQAIIDAIDFMETAKKYNGSYSTGNWWDWQIGSAQQLDDTLILLYNDLHRQDPEKLVKFVQPLLGYAKDPNIQWPAYTATGANLTDISISVLASGLLLEDDKRVALVQQNLPKAMGLVTAKDGIYADGSFVQHTFFPYNGSYGNEMIKGIARVSSTLVGTPWAISEVQFANVFNLIDKGFLQLMVNGRMPSMVSGRSISRAPGTNAETTELETGKETLANLTLIAEATPATLKQKIYQAVATWVAQVGERYNFYDKPRDYAALNGLKTALHQATAQKDDVSSLNIYGAMDRVMQKTPTHAVGIAMYSNRIANFEYGNTENSHAWHTADGMVYLYNNDLNQFGEGYWTTVDPYRLPGTTVDTVSLPDGAKSSSKSPQAWVGGATDGITASVGMALNKANEGQNLKAMKSWFLLDDQIINLGANINGTTAADIETIIDQRQIKPATTQMTVDGQVYTNQKTVSRWANINTADPENNVGYIIAKGNAPVTINQATRTGTYKDINGYFPSDTVYKHTYATLAAMHGATVKNGSYEYVTVPNATDTKVAQLAKSPDYTVLANTGELQAIKTKDQVMANVWTKADQLDGLVSIDQPAAVIIKALGNNVYQLTAAEPSQTDSPINFSFNYPVHLQGKTEALFSTNGHVLTFNPADLAGASRAVTFKLDVPVDRTTLAATIKTAGNLKAKDYTKASFATLTQALTEAKAVIADLATDQQTVDDANTALVAAINGLVKTADTKALQAALTATAKLDAKTYTNASWRDLQAAIDAAKDVLTLDEPTQVMMDHATNAVLTAQKALVKRSQTDPSSKTPPTKPLPADKNGRHQKTQADMPQTGDKVIQWLSLAGVGMLLLIGGLMIWRQRREQ